MKKLIFTLSLFCMAIVSVKAQYCYSTPSGSSVCQPSLQYDTPGLYPVSANLAPIICGADSDITIYFVNYDSLTNPLTGNKVYMDSLTVDSISNLPAGYCWSTGSATNTFSNQEKGCIKVTATPGTTQTPGQYELFILVTVWTNPPLTGQNPFGPIPASAAGLYYYVRVNSSPSAPVMPVDTNGQASGDSTFISYNQTCTTGIPEIEKTVQYLNVQPNPFSAQTQITFNSTTAGAMTEKVTDILGNTVYSKQIDVIPGQNSFTISRNNLSAGLYFYTISDGNSSLTKKLVISE